MRSTIRIFIAALVGLAGLTALTVQAASADDGARIHLIHGIPDTDVDVSAGGEVVFEGFSFGDTQDLSALAGSTLEDLTVTLAGTDTAAIEAGDVSLPADGNFTVVAHLDGEGTPTLSVFENDDSTIEAAKGRLTVRHGAAAPAVDILANGDVAFSNVENGAGGTVDLDVGTISASVVPTGETEPVVIGPADLEIKDGEHLLVYAVGSLEDETLTVVTESITGLHTNPDRVDTGNSLPSDASNNSLFVLVALAGVAVLGGSVFAVRRVQA